MSHLSRLLQDNQRLLSGCNDKKVRVFDLGSGGEEVVMEGHSEPVKCAVWCKEPHMIVSCDERPQLRFVQPHTRSLVSRLLSFRRRQCILHIIVF